MHAGLEKWKLKGFQPLQQGSMKLFRFFHLRSMAQAGELHQRGAGISLATCLPSTS